MRDKPVERQKLYNAIKETYSGGAKLTARECAERLFRKGIVPYPLRQTVAPRLCELCDLGLLETVGSKYDNTTQKTVTIYAIKEA